MYIYPAWNTINVDLPQEGTKSDEVQTSQKEYLLVVPGEPNTQLYQGTRRQRVARPYT